MDALYWLTNRYKMFRTFQSKFSKTNHDMQNGLEGRNLDWDRIWGYSLICTSQLISTKFSSRFGRNIMELKTFKYVVKKKKALKIKYIEI